MLDRTRSSICSIAALLLLTTSDALAQTLRIHHLDVEQGDATLIISPDGHALLFDGGNEGKGRDRVVPRLTALGVGSLDYTFLSHYDADHVGGLDEVILGGFAPIIAYDRGNDTTRNTLAVQNYFNAAAPLRQTLQPGEIIPLGAEVIVEAIAVNGVTSEGTSASVTADEENESSIALLVRYRDFDYFVGGDLTGGGLGTKDVETLVAPIVRDIDVLRLSHHGSPTSSNQALIDRARAEVAIVSVGYSNTYGHPDQTVVDRLDAASETQAIWVSNRGNATVTSAKMIIVGQSNTEDGEIVLVTDGTSSFSVNGTVYGLNVDRTPPVITSGPSVSDVGADRAMISWTTSEPCEAVVEYAPSGGTVQSTLRRSLSLTHAVQVSGLVPGTTYDYRAGAIDATGNGPVWSASGSFTTVATAGGSVVINEVASYGSGGDEWVEIFNGTSVAIDVGGWALTDNDTHTFVFPAVTLPPAGYLIVTSASSGAEDTDGSDGLATLHGGISGRFGTTAVWNNDGDDVVLLDAAGLVADWMAYGSGTGIDPAPEGSWVADAPYPARPGVIDATVGRYPNGLDRQLASDWTSLAASSRGASNGGEPEPPPPPARDPSAAAGAPVIALEGSTVTFDGTDSVAYDGATLVSWHWDFGDGTSGSGTTVTHTYADDGTYAVTLTVTDSSGRTGVDGTSADISNAAPVVSTGGPYTAQPGVAVLLTGAASDVAADVLTYAWSFGDGTPEQAGASVTHTYSTPGTYPLTLTVRDDDGGETSAVSYVTVGWLEARPAVVRVRNNYTGDEYLEGSAVVAELNDPGEGDQAMVSAGDTRWFEAWFAPVTGVQAVERAEVTVSYHMSTTRWRGTLRLELWSDGVLLGSTSLPESNRLRTESWDVTSIITPASAGNLSLRLVNLDTSGRYVRVDWAYAALQIDHQ